MQLAAGVIISGIAIGILYGLFGFVLTFLHKTIGVANFGAGAMGTFEVFFVYKLYKGGLGLWPSVAVGLLLSAAFGFVIYWSIFRPSDGKGTANLMIRTLGIWLLLPAIIQLHWDKGGPFNFPDMMPAGGFTVGGVSVPWTQPITALVAGGLAFLAQLMLSRTTMGLQLQAMAEDFGTARLIGLKVRRLSAVAWVVAAVMAAVVGLIVAPALLLSSTMLDNAMIYAFAAAVIGGGLTSLGGTFVGGVIVGILTSLTDTYWDPYASTAVALVLVMITLIVRPQGLFGVMRVERL